MPAHILHSFPLAAGRSASLTSWWERLTHFLSRGVAGSGAGRVSVRLLAEQVLRLNDASGWTVACVRGSVWITQEADSRDVFLDAGDSFTLDRAGLALVLAMRNAAVAIRPPAGGRGQQAVAASQDSDAAPRGDSAREVWLKAVYPECGPWNDPAAYRRSGLL